MITRIFLILAALACVLMAGRPAAAQNVNCPYSVVKDIAAATDTQILAAGTEILICDYEFSAAGTVAFYLETSSSGTCGATLTKITNTWYAIANLSKAGPGVFAHGLRVPAGLQLCINTNSTAALSIVVYYSR